MRILLINYEFPPLGGGAGIASYEIARGLGTLGHHLEILTSGFPTLPHFEEHDHLTIHRVPVGRSQVFAATPLQLLRFAFNGHRFLQHFRKPPGYFDAVLSFFALPSGAVGEKAARQFACPHVVCLRGMDVPGFDQANLRVLHALLRSTLVRVWQNAHLLLTPSQHLRNLASACDPNARIHVVPNGVRLKARVAPRINHRDPLAFLSVGRMVPQKNHLFMLENLRALQHLPWHLDLVGDGPLFSKLQHFVATHGLASRVTLHGWLSQGDLEPFYQNADLLIHPSGDEGLSNVVLESLSHGLPVLASSAGGTKESVFHTQNGFLFTPGDASALQTALQTFFAMDNAARLALRTQAQASVRHQSWLEIAKQYEKHLMGLLQTNASPLIPGDSAYTHGAKR